jgi:hypothetical protein
MTATEDERVTSEALAGAEQPARTPLGQLLIEAGFLTQAQLDEALYEGSRTGERVGEVVVRRGLVTEDDVARLLAAQWGLDYVERSSIWFAADALARLSREDAQRLEALPTRIEGGRVVVAVAEPTEHRLAALRDVIGEETVMIVVPKSALDAGLRSDLLKSAGGAAGQEPPGQFEPSSPPAIEAVPDPEPEPPPGEDEVEPEHAPLAAVMPLPVTRAEPLREVQIDSDDPAADLADEAQAVADRLLAQAAAVRQQQQELRVRTEQYEARIAELEQALEERTRAVEEAERAALEHAGALEERTAQLDRIRRQLGDVMTALEE